MALLVFIGAAIVLAIWIGAIPLPRRSQAGSEPRRALAAGRGAGLTPSRFFADECIELWDSGTSRLQIERHVQLERAAAEAFCDAPTLEGLYMPTISPLRAGRA